MPSAKTYTLDGAEAATATLNGAIFDVQPNGVLVHRVATALRNNLRQGDADTRTRREVRGGGRKPFRQKGTGNARQGSIREPQMRGGGTVFGPHPRSYRTSVPVKMKRKALCTVLSARARDERICILDDIKIDAPKSKTFSDLYEKLAPERRNTLLITAQYNHEVLVCVQNVARLMVRTAQDVNVLDVLAAQRVVIEKDALDALEKRLA